MHYYLFDFQNDEIHVFQFFSSSSPTAPPPPPPPAALTPVRSEDASAPEPSPRAKDLPKFASAAVGTILLNQLNNKKILFYHLIMNSDVLHSFRDGNN